MLRVARQCILVAVRYDLRALMPNLFIEIHDSVLARVALVEGRAELCFSKLYVHESEGQPGVDAGKGWFQKGVLRIDNAEVKGQFSELPTDLTTGTAKIGEHTFDNCFPLPLKYAGRFELHMQAMWRPEMLSFSGTGAELELMGEPGPVEEFLL